MRLFLVFIIGLLLSPCFGENVPKFDETRPYEIVSQSISEAELLDAANIAGSYYGTYLVLQKIADRMPEYKDTAARLHKRMSAEVMGDCNIVLDEIIKELKTENIDLVSRMHAIADSSFLVLYKNKLFIDLYLIGCEDMFDDLNRLKLEKYANLIKSHSATSQNRKAHLNKKPSQRQNDKLSRNSPVTNLNDAAIGLGLCLFLYVLFVLISCFVGTRALKIVCLFFVLMTISGMVGSADKFVSRDWIATHKGLYVILHGAATGLFIYIACKISGVWQKKIVTVEEEFNENNRYSGSEILPAGELRSLERCVAKQRLEFEQRAKENEESTPVKAVVDSAPVRADDPNVLLRYIVIIDIVLLIIAAIVALNCYRDNFPHGFYTFLRIVTCGVLVWTCVLIPSNFWRIVLGGGAILYNPIFPIHLGDSEAWVIFNIGYAIVNIISLVYWKLGQRLECDPC